MQTTGRNDPCPCRSGKKYKHCCIGAGHHTGDGPAAGMWSLQRTLQLATSLSEAGQLPQAAALCRQILQAEPTQADALHLLGLVSYRAGDTDAAVGWLERAAAARPLFPEAHYHLGLLHMQLGRLDAAAQHYRQAIALAPDFLEAHANLGVVLNRQNAPLQALACFVRALSIREVVEARIGAAECLQRLPHEQLSAAHRDLLTRAVAEAWRRPEELAPAAIALILAEPGQRALLEQDGPIDAQALGAWRDDALLLNLLTSATVCEVTLERGLTRLRAALLAEVRTPNGLDARWLGLASAMARQCFINEYAWTITDPAETELVQGLHAQATATLASGSVPPAEALLLLACYQPLHSLAHADALLASDWPEAVRAVLRQQIEAPWHEETLRAELPRLTPIDDSMSCQVRAQYEANPYPRWARSSLFPVPLPLDDRVRLQVPHAHFRPLGPRETLDVLVAGCGTGRHAIETAHLYRGARVLAIDLSASSLAYAVRQSNALGQRRIEYAQADILQLATLERRFDLIESVGVLHHLAEPEAGWRALLPLLRPGGLMLIGLYSELARTPVVAARQYIAERGFPATAQGIRDCRAALMGCGCPEALKSLTAFGDFFGLSACRDLLFHEQEHRTSLPQIRALLDRLGLDFVGLHVEPSLLKRFEARFPQADAVLDLDLWHRYETEHPTSFVGMYQFWVQKR